MILPEPYASAKEPRFHAGRDTGAEIKPGRLVPQGPDARKSNDSRFAGSCRHAVKGAGNSRWMMTPRRYAARYLLADGRPPAPMMTLPPAADGRPVKKIADDGARWRRQCRRGSAAAWVVESGHVSPCP